MSTFVLVHGAWHGAWAWYKVVPLLESAGHDVITLDLPAHGTDTTPIEEVTLEDYVEHVGEALEAQDEPVVLVGHSSGGVIISQTAEEYAEHIDTLVYLTAFLLDDGEALIGYAEADEESVITQHYVLNEGAGYATVADEGIREGFYADCSEADVTLARSLLRPEPLASQVTPVEISKEGFGSVPRVYLGCEQDRAITPKTQQQMRENLPCDEVRALDTSHSPFLSAPEALVEHLDAVA
jgi:pimeloyl-ACP methyl ester carboxylesterase